MPKELNLKKVLCFIAHAPHLETCLPILGALQKRGNVQVIPVISRRLKKTEPNLTACLRQLELKPVFRSRFSLELLSFFAMKRADAVLSYGDPLAMPKKIRMRDRYLIWSKTPSIFIQHGFLQEGITQDWEHLGSNWYASRILWWDDYDPTKAPFLTAETGARVCKVGFIKKNHIKPRLFPPALVQKINSYRQRLLICTTIPGHEHRFDQANLEQTYAMFDEFCMRNPDILMLMRPHRGKQNTRGKELDEALAQKHDNLIIMDRYAGDFAYTSIHDCLPLCDAVLTHVSSATLDAVYANLPTAMLHNYWDSLAGLPQVRDLASLEAFTENLDRVNILTNPTRQLFGELDQNVECAAKHVEEVAMSQPFTRLRSQRAKP